jgi:hypothetical protein
VRTYHWISLFNVIYKVSKLAYRIWVILIANKRVIKKSQRRWNLQNEFRLWYTDRSFAAIVTQRFLSNPLLWTRLLPLLLSLSIPVLGSFFIIEGLGCLHWRARSCGHLFQITMLPRDEKVSWGAHLHLTAGVYFTLTVCSLVHPDKIYDHWVMCLFPYVFLRNSVVSRGNSVYRLATGWTTEGSELDSR